MREVDLARREAADPISAPVCRSSGGITLSRSWETSASVCALWGDDAG